MSARKFYSIIATTMVMVSLTMALDCLVAQFAAHDPSQFNPLLDIIVVGPVGLVMGYIRTVLRDELQTAAYAGEG